MPALDELARTRGTAEAGRMFTGDRSGDFLFALLHRAGLASQPVSVSRTDGMRLHGVRMTAPVHCAPPQNRPAPAERDTCAPFLRREIELLVSLRVVVALGGFAWNTLLSTLAAVGWQVPRPRPRFGHGASVELVDGTGRVLHLLGCYHVSQQNTFTGRLTPDMLDDVLATAQRRAGKSA